MGKRRVRVIVVPRRASIAMLALTTAALALLIYLLSGHAYATETHSTRDLIVQLVEAGAAGRLSGNRALIVLMPVVANMLPFVPWGFFAFVVLDRPKRSRLRTYGMTIVACLLFVASIGVWQEFLATRVTTFSDSIANAAGALAGAVLGHLRRQVHVVFDV